MFQGMLYSICFKTLQYSFTDNLVLLQFVRLISWGGGRGGRVANTFKTPSTFEQFPNSTPFQVVFGEIPLYWPQLDFKHLSLLLLSRPPHLHPSNKIFDRTLSISVQKYCYPSPNHADILVENEMNVAETGPVEQSVYFWTSSGWRMNISCPVDSKLKSVWKVVTWIIKLHNFFNICSRGITQSVVERFWVGQLQYK